MADTPEGAVEISDDDLDELVDKEMGSSTAGDTDDDGSDAGETGETGTTETPGETSEGTADDDAAETRQREAREQRQTQARPAAPAAAAAPAAQVAGEKPFQFKGAGQVHAFPDALELPDGSVKLGKDGVARLRQTLGSYVEISQNWKQERRTLTRRVEQAEKARNNKDIAADAITTLFKDIEKMSPEDRWKWANEFGEKAPKLTMQIERDQLAAERAALDEERAGPKLSDEEQAEQFSNTLISEVRSTFQRIFEHPDAKILNADDRKYLWEKWTKRAPRLVARAEADDAANGVKKGDPVFDDSDIVDDVVDRIKVRKAAAGTASAATRNEKLNADRGGKRPPPVVRGARAVSGSGQNNNRAAIGKDRRKFKAEFLRGNLDADDE